MSATVQRGFSFEQTIPTTPPNLWTTCTGRPRGSFACTRTSPPAPTPIYDLASPSQQWSLYSAVVRDGLPSEQAAILNRSVLLTLWADLNLPVRCRAIWEDDFPELAELSRTKAS